jgi:hypothetical protein
MWMHEFSNIYIDTPSAWRPWYIYGFILEETMKSGKKPLAAAKQHLRRVLDDIYWHVYLPDLMNDVQEDTWPI